MPTSDREQDAPVNGAPDTGANGAAPIYLDSAIKKLETLVLRAEAAAPRTAELLVEALKDEEPEARAVALRAVGLFGEDAGPYRPALRAALGDADEEVRAAAADALWRAGAADDLIDALKGDDEAAEVRFGRADRAAARRRESRGAPPGRATRRRARDARDAAAQEAQRARARRREDGA